MGFEAISNVATAIILFFLCFRVDFLCTNV